MRSNNIYIYRR